MRFGAFCIAAATLVGCTPRAVSLGHIDADAATDGAATSEWLITFGGPGAQAALALLRDGERDLFVAGVEPGAWPAVDPHDDVFVASLSPRNGAVVWRQTLAERDLGFADRAAGLALGASGIALAGHTGANPTESIPFIDVVPRTGGPATSHTTPFANAPCARGTTCVQEGSQDLNVAIDLGGGASAMGGVFRGNPSTPLPWLQTPTPAADPGVGFVAVIDARGARWGRTLGDVGVRRVTGLAAGDDGSLLVVGTTAIESLPASESLVVLRFDGTGRTLATRAFTCTGGLRSPRAARLGTGWAVVGQLNGTLSLPPGEVRSVREDDVFVLALDTNLTPRWHALLVGGLEPHGEHAVAPDGTALMVACGACLPPGSPQTQDPDAAGPAVARLSADGALLGWATLPVAGKATLHAVVAGAAGHAVVGGAADGDGFVAQVKILPR